MNKFFLIYFFGVLYSFAQPSFEYNLVLTPKVVSGLPGLHSYAYGQHEGKWLIVGGRKDGLHARQPFNAFPGAQNNTDIYVVDIATLQSWSASVNVLPLALKEQLQSTNMNFFQDQDTLLILGGYAFSASANDHKTFDDLTAINVSGLINAIINQQDILPFFKQISNPLFAITGGQLGKIGNDFYLVGGHRFDGRYNPMGNPTFTQSYSNQIRKFTVDNSGSQLSFSSLENITDEVHLHRRDFNLVPQVFQDGSLGYTISSGVFQINADLPFLYPVDIKNSGYFPQTSFNQYLSHYHSGKVAIFDQNQNAMHSLFFGGMSQYYYNGTALIQDNNVPFVKTISRVSRASDGSLTEHKLDVEMPNLKGAGAEFILNKNLPHFSNEVLNLAQISNDEFVIGHLFGGIQSPTMNPFANNQTNTTIADASIYEVKLVYNPSMSVGTIDGQNPFHFSIFPNPTSHEIVQLEIDLPYQASLDYFITSMSGKILDEGEIEGLKIGKNKMNFNLSEAKEKVLVVTFIFDAKFYQSQKIIITN